MNFSKAIVPFAIIFSFLGCGGEIEPTPDNLKENLETYLASQRVCYSLGSDITDNVALPTVEPAAARWERFAVYEKLGFIVRQTVLQVPQSYSSHRTGRKVAVKQFDLTDEGRKFFFEENNGIIKKAGFCYGEKALNKIESISQPTATAIGTKTVTIDYLYDSTVYDWFKANKAEIIKDAKDFTSSVPGESRAQRDTVKFVLTKTGWKHPDLIDQSELIIDKSAAASASQMFSGDTEEPKGIGGKLQDMIFGF